jgi:hypothetical protein
MKYWVLVAAIGAASCGPTAPSPTTGLTGTVERGPITPVCFLDRPCNAPFSATFTVQRNGERVAQFRSDAAGQFTVMLEPGMYRVVPNADAPLIAPASQVREVTVESVGLTTVHLVFDTGIR